MRRVMRWVLAILGIVLIGFSLYRISASGRPAFAADNGLAWAGVLLGFLILMVLLYSLSVKVGILYTILLLLLCILFLLHFFDIEIPTPFTERNQTETQNTVKDENTAKETTEETTDDKKATVNGEVHGTADGETAGTSTGDSDKEQLDEEGNLVIEHPYDDLLSLQWGTFNDVDMDLMLVDKNDTSLFVNFSNPQYSRNKDNSIWLDYDYQYQENIARKEVISILGLTDHTFSVLVVNYNGEPLRQDAILVITLSSGRTVTYDLPAERFNDDTDGIYVCDIMGDTITEVMEDFKESDLTYP